MSRRGNWRKWELRGRAEAWLARMTGSSALRIDQGFRRLAGLNHQNLHFSLSNGGSLDETLMYILRLPGEAGCYEGQPEDAINRAMVREAETLRLLEGRVGAFATPELLLFEEAAPEFDRQPAMLLTVCPGMPLDEKALHRLAEEGCGMIGRIMAAVHALPASEFGHLSGHESAHAHLEARAEGIPQKTRTRDPDGLRAMRFVRAALAEEDAPPRVIHGDMLPQNIIHPLWDKGAPPGLIDWEFACLGDPAWDFALLFRGTRKLLGLSAGRSLVLEAYTEAGGLAPSLARISAYEMTLLLDWIAAGQDPGGQHRHQLANLCRRLDSRERAAGVAG